MTKLKYPIFFALLTFFMVGMRPIHAQFFRHFRYDSLGLNPNQYSTFRLHYTAEKKVLLSGQKQNNFKASLLHLSESKTTDLLEDSSVANPGQHILAVAYSIKDQSYWMSMLNCPGLWRYKNKQYTFFRFDSLIQNWEQYQILIYSLVTGLKTDQDSNTIYLTGGGPELMSLSPEKEKVKFLFRIPTGNFLQSSPQVYTSPTNKEKYLYGIPNTIGRFEDSVVTLLPNSIFGVQSGTIFNLSSIDNASFWFFNFDLKRWRNGQTLNLSQALNWYPSGGGGYTFGLEKNGDVWFGYSDGIFRYSFKKGLKEYSRFEYPFFGGTQNIVVDTNNNKWVSSWREVTLVKDVKTRILDMDTSYFACQAPLVLLKQATQTFGDGIASYRWILGDGRQVFGDSVQVAFPVPGRYRIMLTALDSNGSKDHDSIWITVKPHPFVPTLTFSGDTIKPCKLPHLVSVSNANRFSKLVWRSIQDIDSVIGPEYLIQKNGKYQLRAYSTLVIPENTCYIEKEFWVRKRDIQKPRLSVNVGNQAAFESPGRYEISIWPPVSGQVQVIDPIAIRPNYQVKVFANSESLLLDGDGKGNYIFSAFTPVQFRIHLFDRWGCDNEDSLLVVPKELNLEIPNLITSNGDQLNDYFSIPQLPIIQSFGRLADLQIFNRWGQRIFKTSNYQNDWPAGSETEAGNYFYLLRLGAEKQYSGWILLNK